MLIIEKKMCYGFHFDKMDLTWMKVWIIGYSYVWVLIRKLKEARRKNSSAIYLTPKIRSIFCFQKKPKINKLTIFPKMQLSHYIHVKGKHAGE